MTHARLLKIEGYVWCHKEGAVHEDTLDPFHYPEDMHCDPKDHQVVYRNGTVAEGEGFRRG